MLVCVPGIEKKTCPAEASALHSHRAGMQMHSPFHVFFFFFSSLKFWPAWKHVHVIVMRHCERTLSRGEKKLINKSQRERLNYVQSAWIGMAQHFVSSANLNFFGTLHERDWYISSSKYHIPMKINILTRTKKRDFLTSQGLLMFHISDYCLPACWIFLFFTDYKN